MKVERRQFERYMGIDAHKDYVVIGGINVEMERVLHKGRMSLGEFKRWAPKHLRPTDAVAIEASTNTWVLYDLIEPLVGEAVVVHPLKVKLIASAKIKTDKVDVFKLAKLMMVGWLPEVWVPPQPVRDLRALIAHRWRLVRTRTAAKNRLHSVLQRNAISAKKRRPFTEKDRGWWAELDVSETEKLRIKQDLENVDRLSKQIEEIEAELNRLSTSEYWADQVPYVMQLPGFGIILTMTVLGAIGDIHRFATAKKLVGYSGLGAGVHDSGRTHKGKGITKQGRKDLRWAMVEAAWSAVRYDPYWKAEFERLEKRMSSKKAIVAIARKLLVTLWHVLSKKEAYRHGTEEQIARTMMVWSWAMGKDARKGMVHRQFVRYALMHLGIGQDLDRIEYSGSSRRIASEEEVLSLCPELGKPG